MPGVDWPREIERQIDVMSALVVVWTAASKDSKYVRAEAIPAFDREKLVNIMFGVKEPPLPFNLYNGFALDGWTGREPHEGWTRLVRTLEAKLVKTGEVKQGQLVAALGRREQGVRRLQGALAAAEEAFAAAKAADGEADAALANARTALGKAEEQLAQVSAMHAGPNVIRGAQADLDEAHANVGNAEAARRTAAGDLTRASRALAQAKRAVETSFVTPPELSGEPGESTEDAAVVAEPDAGLDAGPRAAASPTRASPASAPQPSASAQSGASVGMALGAAAGAASAPDPGGANPSAASAGPGAAAGGTAVGATGGPGSAPAKRSSPMPLLIGGAAVLLVGLLAIVLFSGKHHTPPADDLANATNVADANVADNAAANVADDAASSVTLADQLNQLQTELTAQGAVAWEGFAHDSNPPQGYQSDWTYQKRVETSDITYDASACDFDFHFKVTVDGKVTTDDSNAGIPLKELTTIRVSNLADMIMVRDAQSGHPTYSSRLQPAIYSVEAIRTNGTLNELDFYSLETAQRVGRLLQGAAQKCGASPVIRTDPG
jgi:hypothetical protein